MTTTTRTIHQKRWEEIVRDPALCDLPYKVETNERGQLLLSPHTNRHSDLQETLQDLLRKHAPAGRQPPEYAIATSQGVKAPDVVWMSSQREQEMAETGDPTTLAPEICVEILSATNTEAEMQEKRRLYLDAGAEEVWIVSEDGRIRFFSEEEREQSEIAPECPTRVSSYRKNE